MSTQQLALHCRAEINNNSGTFVRGHAYDFTEKFEVANVYITAKKGNNGIRPTSA